MPASRTSSKSATAALSGRLTISLIGVCAAIAMLGFTRNAGLVKIEAALAVALIFAVIVLAGEVLLYRAPWAPGADLDFIGRRFNLARIGTKLLGLYATFAIIGLLYWLFPEYRTGQYQPFFVALSQLGAVIALVAIPYVAFVDCAMRTPEDGLYLAGRLALMDWEVIRAPALRQYALGWLVKAFFLPIMFGVLVNNTETLLRADINIASLTFSQFFALASLGMFWVDVLVACVGYACALRLFDTHIRSAEPTGFGWAICLICYPPFQTVFTVQYLAYSAPNALKLLADQPTLQFVWGTATLLLLAVYTLATIAFGCRFSNITHRGIIDSGPYRFTKHPAYVAKNMYWWLLHAPFLTASDASEAVRYCILLAGINLVYFLRARTEERHLSLDPAYVAYASAMNERSIFAGLARHIPALRYRAP